MGAGCEIGAPPLPSPVGRELKEYKNMKKPPTAYLNGHHYSALEILKWLWRAWRGNRLQAALNAGIGLLSVGVSLAQVWAVQHAIEVAEGVDAGSLYVAVGIMAVLILCTGYIVKTFSPQEIAPTGLKPAFYDTHCIMQLRV